MIPDVFSEIFTRDNAPAIFWVLFSLPVPFLAWKMRGRKDF